MKEFQSCKSLYSTLDFLPQETGTVQERTEFDEPDFALIDTLFSLAEAHLFMQIIELMESKAGIMPPNKGFAEIYRCPGSLPTCYGPVTPDALVCILME